MIKATKEDRNLVKDILVSAFENYTERNSINLIIKPDNKRKQRLEKLMGYLFDTCLMFGEVLVSNDRKGCLLIKYPNRVKTTFRTIYLDLKLAIQCIGIERVFGVLKRERITKKYTPKEEHIKIMILGVKTEFKGKGTAARFMLDVQNHYNTNTLPVFIDTASEYNARLYEKFGFKIKHIDTSLGFNLYFMQMN